MATKQSWRLPDLSSVALQEGPSGSFLLPCRRPGRARQELGWAWSSRGLSRPWWSYKGTNRWGRFESSNRPKAVFVPILLCFRKPFSYSVVSLFFRGWLPWRCPPEVTSDLYRPLPCGNLCSEEPWGICLPRDWESPWKPPPRWVPAFRHLPECSSREWMSRRFSMGVREGKCHSPGTLAGHRRVTAGTSSSTTEVRRNFIWSRAIRRSFPSQQKATRCALSSTGRRKDWSLAVGVWALTWLQLATKSGFNRHVLIYLLAACLTSQGCLISHSSANCFSMPDCHWNLVCLPRVPRFSQKMCLVIQGVFRLRLTKQQY